MPRLWTSTVDAHRRQVRDAIIEATIALVMKRPLKSVSMSEIAVNTGIGRATLYKYFPDVRSILLAWHQERVAQHLEQLLALGEGDGTAFERLCSVLEAYALIQHEHHGTELAGLLHGAAHLAHAEDHLRRYLAKLIRAAAAAGNVRRDVAAEELATFCFHALRASASLASKPAVRRLVSVTVAGLRR